MSKSGDRATGRPRGRGWRSVVLASVIAWAGVASAADSQRPPWADIGRAATSDEIAAWDIDVLPDFTGLPAGRGSVDQGIEIWEAQCASCHGIFGESNEVFPPLVGGTTEQDIETGRVAGLVSGNHPHRTTFMKLSQISSLWDYINRAMPWNAPKSLKADEVYAVTAYLLNLAEIVPEDFVLSNENIGQVQQRLPNRNGMVRFDGMWRVDGTPDVQGDDCMKDCATAFEVHSSLPDFARDQHGNLAEQHRLIGPVRGALTTESAPKDLQQTRAVVERIAAAAQIGSVPTAGIGPAPAAGGAAAGGPTLAAAPVDASALASRANCLACHGVDRGRVGPGLKDVAKRHKGNADAVALLSVSVRNGSQGKWGAIPMPPNPGLADEDIRILVEWIVGMSP